MTGRRDAAALLAWLRTRPPAETLHQALPSLPRWAQAELERRYLSQPVAAAVRALEAEVGAASPPPGAAGR